MDGFCARQFNNPDYTGTQIHYDMVEFESKVNAYFEANGKVLADGYAPFCKHVFMPNFVPGIKCGYVPKTSENKHLIESSYEARTDKELAVLVEFISKDQLIGNPDAEWLDIILYSREQIVKENEATGTEPPKYDASWGIISVKGQTVGYETPMQPITIMRNCLGKEYGGSGVDIDFEKYKQSVDFWVKNVAIK
jgi:hypothetical protein